MPTAICNSRLRSGSAHWDLELAVEVRLCPLGSGLRGGGGGGGGGGCGRRRRRRRTALIKSNNPHLAGGENMLIFGRFKQLHTKHILSIINGKCVFSKMAKQNVPPFQSWSHHYERPIFKRQSVSPSDKSWCRLKQ